MDSAIVVCLVLEIYVKNPKIRWSHEGRDPNGCHLIYLIQKLLDCLHEKIGNISQNES